MTVTSAAVTESVEKRLRHVLDLHFDPASGSPYWLQLESALKIDAREEINSLEDLALLGPMDTEALASRPFEDFVPQSCINQVSQFIMAETGGTLGKPKFAVHRSDEWSTAFVAPFVAAAKRADFPKKGNWLFVGPTGPHIIGKAARACAMAAGAPDPFSVDFDPRWARKLPPDSFARKRYHQHIEDQAMHVITTQKIQVLFSTPPVLESLGERMPAETRLRIRGVHLGGMSVSPAHYALLKKLFPEAVLLSGYGNTLFGMAPELECSPEHGISYYPYGSRLVMQAVIQQGDNDAPCLGSLVSYGERGRVVAHRFDEIQFIANMVERDTAVRVAPLPDAVKDGFVLDGVQDPQPISTESMKPVAGLY